MVDETYSHGNGFESWCGSNSLIPDQLYRFQTYSIPICSAESCLMAKFYNGTMDPFLTPSSVFFKQNVLTPTQFVCSKP